jgi:hypothetical protein
MRFEPRRRPTARLSVLSFAEQGTLAELLKKALGIA